MRAWLGGIQARLANIKPLIEDGADDEYTKHKLEEYKMLIEVKNLMLSTKLGV